MKFLEYQIGKVLSVYKLNGGIIFICFFCK